MTPPSTPFRGGAKWGDVLTHAGLSVLAAVLAWGVFTQVPSEVVAMRLLACYTAFAALVTAALAVALALTQRLPTWQPAELQGKQAWKVQAWPGDWWYTIAIDLGLVVLAGGLTVLGVGAGGAWLVGALPVAALGAWLSGRLALSFVGRRNNESLWLTEDLIVHRAAWGVASSTTDAVVRVVVPRDGTRLRIVLDGPAELRLCPRPWRGKGRPVPDQLVFDCSRTGHDAGALQRWFETRLPAE